MIKFAALAVITDEEDGKAEPFSASFDQGVTCLPYSDKKIFDCLSFAFSDIVSGSLMIDGLEISAKNKQNGRIYELSVCISEVADVIGVFSLPNGIKDSLTIQRDIGKEVRSLRELPTKSDEDKKSKLSSLFDVFSKNKVAYVLIDFNDALNGKNPDVIKTILAAGNLTVVTLESKPQDSKVIQTFVQPNLVVSGGVWPFLTIEYLSFAFVAIFSLLASFGGFAAACLLGTTQILGGAISGVIAFLCLAMDLVVISSIYQSFLKSARSDFDFLNVELISVFSTLIGLAIGLGLSFLFSKNGIMINASSVTPLSIVVGCAISVSLLFSSLASRPLFAFFEKVAQLLKR
jgi:hypothetical protein